MPAGSPTHPLRCAFQVMTIPVLPIEAKVPARCGAAGKLGHGGLPYHVAGQMRAGA